MIHLVNVRKKLDHLILIQLDLLTYKYSLPFPSSPHFYPLSVSKPLSESESERVLWRNFGEREEVLLVFIFKRSNLFNLTRFLSNSFFV